MTVPGLTARQCEIADMVCKPMTNREIAAALNIELNSVKTHLTAIFKKLGVKNRHELILLLKRKPETMN